MTDPVDPAASDVSEQTEPESKGYGANNRKFRHIFPGCSFAGGRRRWSRARERSAKSGDRT
jgi:hypothetical protein